MLSNEVYDRVYTIVKMCMQDLTKRDSEGESVQKWADLFYTRNLHDIDDPEPQLPLLCMRQIGAPQIGNDLMRNAQNGVDSTFQVESFSSVSYDEAYEIINDAGNIFIELGYALTYGVMELPTGSPTLWRFLARFNRVVGANDTLSL